MSAADGIVETGNAQAWIGGVHAGVAMREAQLRAQQLQNQGQHYQQMFGAATDRTAASREHWQDMADAAQARTQLGYDKLSASQSQHDQTKKGLIDFAVSKGLDMVPTLEDGSPDPDALDALSNLDVHTLNDRVHQSYGSQLRLQNRQAIEHDTAAKAATQLQSTFDAIDGLGYTPEQTVQLKNAAVMKLGSAGTSVLHHLAQQKQSQQIAAASQQVMGPDGQPVVNDQQSALMRSLPPQQAANMARQAAAPPKKTAAQQNLDRLVKADSNVLSTSSHLKALDGQLMRVNPYTQADLHAKLLNDREALAKAVDDATQGAIHRLKPARMPDVTLSPKDAASLAGQTGTPAPGPNGVPAAPAPPPLDPQTANTLQKMLGTFKQQTGRDYNRQDPNDVAAMRQIEQSLTGGG